MRCPFPSRSRAASHFRNVFPCLTPDGLKFQSRSRAASHFRHDIPIARFANINVSISFSSGFSFQEPPWYPEVRALHTVSISFSSGFSFQVRARRAFALSIFVKFQSRSRAASHFRQALRRRREYPIISFNLVLERLLISGAVHEMYQQVVTDVSISFSSGFSFQAPLKT